jgi:hypothetical protein
MITTSAPKDHAAKIRRRTRAEQTRSKPLQRVSPSYFTDFSFSFLRPALGAGFIFSEGDEGWAGSSASRHLTARVA